MKQTWLVGAGLVAIIFITSALPAMAETSTSNASSAGFFSAENLLKRLPQLTTAPSADQQSQSAQDVDQKIEKANDWFKTTTGLGLDDLARAAWKLILWLVRHAITWAWAIVAWLTKAVGVGTP